MVAADLHGRHAINVATGRETSLLDLRAAIMDVTDYPLPYVMGPERQGDIMRSCAGVARLRELLGVICATTLRDGLAALLTGARALSAAG